MEQDFELKNTGTIKYLNCKKFNFNDLSVHAFTTRLGGISVYPYNSLNLSLNVGDKEDHVLENRRRILNVLGIDYLSVVSAQQIHEDKITVIKREDKGKGALKYLEGISGSDALITDIPEIPLLLCYADCTPILILDPIKKVIGLIHAGRKGTQLKITFKTLLKMKEVFKTEPHFCLAAIFPSINPRLYNFKNQDSISDWINDENICNNIVYRQGENSWHIDLKKANYMQLIKGGMREKNIFISSQCTTDNQELFFSDRQDKKNTGRMAAIFMLKGSK